MLTRRVLLASVGVATPRNGPLPGAVRLTRVRVHGWVLERFRLLHPLRTDINQLTRSAPRYFHHAPQWVLAFIQLPGGGRSGLR